MKLPTYAYFVIILIYDLIIFYVGSLMPNNSHLCILNIDFLAIPHNLPISSLNFT